MNNKLPERFHGGQPPTVKDILIVVIAAAVLIAFSWIGYYKFHWFH